MFNCLRGLAVAACLTLSAPLTSIAVAQTGAEAAAELDQLGRWMDQVRPVANDLFNVLGPIDEADAILLQYVEANLGYEEARAQTADAKERVLLIGEDLRSRIAAIPPFPDLIYIQNPRIAASVEDLATMVDTMEDLAINQIDLYASALEGDDLAVETLQSLSIDRAIASVEITNQILASDIASITDLTHPQLAVLNSAYASNEIVIQFLKIEKGRQFEFSADAEKTALKNIQDKVREIRNAVQKGKRDQTSAVARMNTAQIMANDADKPVLKQVGLMMQEYAKAWPVELQIAQAWEDLAAHYRSAALGEDTATAYDAAFGTVAALEEQRQKLLFDRVALMKQ